MYKKIVSLFILFILIVRVFLGINWVLPKKNKIIFAEIELKDSRSKIVKIDNKYLYKNIYTNLSGLEDGLYRGKFKIISEKINDNYILYDIKAMNIKKIEPFFVKKYMNKVLDRFLKDANYEFKNTSKVIILGESHLIDRETKEKFRYIGLAHILAMSGLHMGILFFMFNFILIKLKIARKPRNIAVLILGTIYFMGVETSPSFMRAYIMGSIYILGKICYEDVDVLKLIFISSAVSIMINPASFMKISFILSYGAILGIYFLYPVLRQINIKKYKIFEYLLFVLSIHIFMIPIFLKIFKTVYFFSFFTNLLLLPLGSLFIIVLYTGFLLEHIFLGGLAFYLANKLYIIFIFLVNFTNNLPYQSLNYKGDISYFLIAIYYLTIFIIWRLTYENNRKRNLY